MATANFSATGTLMFRTVMVEKHVHFPVQSGTNGEKDFDDVAIAAFPSGSARWQRSLAPQRGPETPRVDRCTRVTGPRWDTRVRARHGMPHGGHGA